MQPFALGARSARSNTEGPSISRFAIVTAYGNLDSIPVLCDLAQLLAERGHRVDIFTERWPGFGLPQFTHPAIRVVVVRTSRLRRMPAAGDLPSSRGGEEPRRLHRWSYALGRRTLGLLGGFAASRAWQAARKGTVDIRLSLEGIRSRLSRDRYLFVIGVDPEGLRRAWVLSRLSRAAIAYHSLELMLSSEVSTAEEKALKATERQLSRRARLVIIQDEERARLLAADNAISPARFVFVPNAPPGPARRSPSRWWHEQFGLAPGTRVLLHSGSIGPWTGIEGIVRAAHRLPDGWVLVVHTRYDPETAGPEEARRFDELRRQSAPDKVWFSLRPVPRTDLHRLVDGADAGIAFYVPLDDGDTYTRENVRSIGLSSGKVASYLVAGLPIIANSASSLGELVESEGIGITVASADELPQAVERIAADYDAYAYRARAFFDERLDLRRSFEQLLTRLQVPPSAGAS